MNFWETVEETWSVFNSLRHRDVQVKSANHLVNGKPLSRNVEENKVIG